MSMALARRVPCLLTAEIKAERMGYCRDLLNFVKLKDINDLLDGLVTVDKTFLYQHDLEMKFQSLQWKKNVRNRSPRRRKIICLC